MFVADWRAELIFGEHELLVPALNFVNGRDIVVMADISSVTYYHLLFDAHEIVTANGVATESFHVGDMALMFLTDTAQQELALIFPDFPSLQAGRKSQMVRKTARRVARKFEAQMLLDSVA